MGGGRREFHVEPASGRWRVRVSGHWEEHRFDTHEEAMILARRWAHANEPSTLLVYRADGSLLEQFDYPVDPSRWRFGSSL